MHVFGKDKIKKIIRKNILDKKFRVIGYDVNQTKRNEISHSQYNSIKELEDLKSYNQNPVAVFLMLPADKISDDYISTVFPLLHPESVVIDGGNSHFKDSIRRVQTFAEMNYQYLGVGISGGAEGALKGPSMMIGGHKASYEKLAHIFRTATKFPREYFTSLKLLSATTSRARWCAVTVALSLRSLRQNSCAYSKLLVRQEYVLYPSR